MKFNLKFTINGTIKFDEKIITIKPSHLEAIENHIKNNARTNSQDEIISKFGIIKLLNTNITCETQLFTFDIVLETEENAPSDINTAEEIIYAILPASYTYEDKFIFNICSLFRKNKTYTLNILDTPNILNIQVINS